jgi:hypothetical protein
MFRHHYITDQREIVALANFIQNLEKEIPSPLRAQQRRAAITTACNKVQLAQPIAASQALLHPENTNPSYPEGFGTPHGSRELSSELVVWYYPPGRNVNAKIIRKGSPPAQAVKAGNVTIKEVDGVGRVVLRTDPAALGKGGKPTLEIQPSGGGSSKTIAIRYN